MLQNNQSLFLRKRNRAYSKKNEIRPSEFLAKHLQIDEDKDYVLNVVLCPILDSENYCSIYTDRPTAFK